MTTRHRKAKTATPAFFHSDTEAYERLAAGIVESACRDYIAAKRTVMFAKRSRKRQDAEGSLIALRRFFHSQWYATLCDIDADRLISMLDEAAADPSITFWVASH